MSWNRDSSYLVQCSESAPVLERILIQPLITDRIWIRLSKMYRPLGLTPVLSHRKYFHWSRTTLKYWCLCCCKYKCKEINEWFFKKMSKTDFLNRKFTELDLDPGLGPENRAGSVRIPINNCSLPHRRVHEIKRTYLASRIHGLFIT
jgi:hypothetical protein